MNEIISFYTKIYKQELSQSKLLHLYSSRILKRFFIGDQEDILTEENPYIPLSDKDGEEIIKTLSLKSNEVSLRYFSMARVSNFVSLNKYESTRIYPLFAFEATVTIIDDAYYLSIDTSSREVLKNNLPQTIVGSIDFKKLRHRQPLDFHFASKLKIAIEKNDPEAETDELLLYPKLWSDKKLKTFQKEDFKVGEKYVPIGVLAIVEKENNSFTTLNELEELTLANDLSAPLLTLFGAQENSALEKTGIICEELNTSQLDAIKNSNEKIISLISGPPGTGKSFTIANITAEKVSKGQSVLITSKNKEALDVIEEKIKTQLGLTNLCVNPSQDKNLAGIKNYLTFLLGRKYVRKKIGFNDVEDSFQKFQLMHDKHLELEKNLIHQFEIERVHHKRLRSNALLPIQNNLQQRIYEIRGKQTTPLWQSLEDYYGRIQRLRKSAVRILKKVNDFRINNGISENRTELRNYLSFLKARERNRKADLSTKIDYPTVLKAFPVWLVRANDVSKILPTTKETFDVLIIDEASQCDIPSLIPLMQRAKKVIIVGDTRQLTHISFISKAFEAGCKITVPDNQKHLCVHRDYSILHLAEELLDPMDKVELNEHFRSQFPIISFSNQQFYQNKLEILTKRPLSITDHVQFVQTKGKRNRGYVQTEVTLMLKKVKGIITKETDLPAHLKTSIGLLSPFRKQVDYIFSRLAEEISLNDIKAHKICVGTAFTFQGNERDIMLISMGLDSNALSGSFTYLNRDDVFNVSMTRARNTQIIYYSFDPSDLKQETTLAHFFRFYNQEIKSDFGRDSKDEFCLEVQAELKQYDLITWTNFQLSGVSIDLIVRSGDQFFGIDLIGFPGEMEDYYSLERYKMIQRGKINVFPLPYALWRGDRKKCIEALLNLVLDKPKKEEMTENNSPKIEVKNEVNPIPNHLVDMVKTVQNTNGESTEFKLVLEKNIIGHLILQYMYDSDKRQAPSLVMFIQKKYRFQGLEEDLLDSLDRYLIQDSKIVKLDVTIDANDTKLIEIFENYGFEQDSEHPIETNKKVKSELKLAKQIR